MDDQLLDSNFQENSYNENVEPWAGFWIRFAASLLDSLVLVPVFVLNWFNLTTIKSLPLQLLIMVLLALYKPWMEYRFGATLGKMICKIKVTNLNFERISVEQATIRYIPWIVGHLISVYTAMVLFQHPEFAETSTFLDIGYLQNELVSQALNQFSSVILLVFGLSIAFRLDKRGFHDLMAKTYCVHRERI